MFNKYIIFNIYWNSTCRVYTVSILFCEQTNTQMHYGYERVCVFIICSSVKNNWIFEIGEVGSQRAARDGGWKIAVESAEKLHRQSVIV